MNSCRILSLPHSMGVKKLFLPPHHVALLHPIASFPTLSREFTSTPQLYEPKGKSMLRYTQKFLNGGMYEKLNWQTPGQISKGGGMAKKKIPKGVTKVSKKRLHVLNKIFLDNVKSIMAFGEVSQHLGGRDINISGVRVLEEMQGLQVFWYTVARDDNLLKEGDESTKDLLRRVAPLVRQELCNQRVTTLVPPITFKEDPDVGSTLEVVSILNQLGLFKTKADREIENKRNQELLEDHQNQSDECGSSHSSKSVHSAITPSSEKVFDPKVPEESLVPENTLQKTSSETDPYAHLFDDSFDAQCNVQKLSWNREKSELLGVSQKRDIFSLNCGRILEMVQSVIKNSHLPHQPLPPTDCSSYSDATQNIDSPAPTKMKIKQWAKAYTKLKNKHKRRTEEKRMDEEEAQKYIKDYALEQQEIMYEEYEMKLQDNEEDYR